MKRLVLVITMIVGISIFALSCGNNKQEEDKEGYEFYYYPQKNVYYNLEKKTFFYSFNGGKTWDSTISSPGKDPGTLGEKVIIYSDNNDVYKDNLAHRKKYNGRLYNIVNSDIALTPAAPEVTERKVVKKSSTAEVKPKPDEDKPKKGLKKFLNKIFGKHNKKKATDSLDQ